jgi:hypothetical protein
MAISLDQIVEETFDLPGEVVAELIDRIMAALSRPLQLPGRRISRDASRKLNRGKVKGVPLEEFLARARKIAGL